MSILGGLFGLYGSSQQLNLQRELADISAIYNAQRQHQVDLMQMQMFPGGSPYYPVLAAAEARNTRHTRRDCPNCGAPARPVCDYCGS